MNAPVSVLSWGANGGDVDQSNDATTTAGAKNTNGTDQSVDQDQQAASKGSGTGGIDQSQDATNGNETSQEAGADASTKQANVNVPVAILSWGANGGDVNQTNAADTKAYADNANGTDQGVDQNQDGQGRRCAAAPATAPRFDRPDAGRHQRQQHRPVGRRVGPHEAAQRQRADQHPQLGIERWRRRLRLRL